MKYSLMLLLILMFNLEISAQSKIPESIKSDLTLRPQAKPFESTGFDVEKGVTLTILPGTKIKMSAKSGDKNAFPMINVYGTLVIGAKSGDNSKTVTIEGIANGPWIVFTDATIEINGLDLIDGHPKFVGNNSGTIKNSNFTQSIKSYMYPFYVAVPKKGNLTFQNCLIENQGLDLATSDFPNDLDRLTFNKCAFTTKWIPNNKKFKQFFLPMKTFAYGTQCDSYLEVEFKPFDWVLKKPIVNEWHIGDDRLRKMTEDSLKLSKTFSMKLPSKPFTKFKQEEAPEKEKK